MLKIARKIVFKLNLLHQVILQYIVHKNIFCDVIHKNKKKIDAFSVCNLSPQLRSSLISEVSKPSVRSFLRGQVPVIAV